MSDMQSSMIIRSRFIIRIFEWVFYILQAIINLEFWLDEIKKKVWMTFVAEIFLTVDPLSWEDEIVPFLDVLSCGLIQYPESVLILKNYTVAMLKISMHFPEKFIEYSKDHIFDTVIKIYSGSFSNWSFAFSSFDRVLSLRPNNFWKFDQQNLIRQ